MEMYDSFCTIIGLIAVGIGIYELVTKKLVGRDLDGVSQDKIQKFLPYDVVTYVIAGGLMALTGANSKFTFMQNTTVMVISIAISLGAVAMNVYFTKKYLGIKKQNPRLK